MKKCVVIGSGLGGLSSGCIMAKNGYEVTVLEQGVQIGGCLQCFRRGDALFETGMHYIGSATPGQTLHTILKYLGVGTDIPLSPLDSNGYDVVSFMGERFPFANGRENFIDTLAARFPQCRDQLARYYDLIKEVTASSAIHSLNRAVDLNLNAEYQLRSVNAVIDQVVTDPILQQVLAGIQPLYAGVKEKTPFSTHALIFDFYNQSAYRIVGGSSIVAAALVRSVKEMGGEVLPRRKAVRIECDKSRATAVITSDGERFPADLIISSIHPTLTLQLIDSHLIRPAYRQRINHIRNTTAAFTVYLKFKKNRVRYMDSNLYIYRGDTIWGCEDYDAQSWPKCLLYMHFCHQPNPEYAEVGEIITYMRYDEVSQWAGTHVGQRGEGYEKFKTQKAETILDAMEKEIPGIRDCIECYYTSSPLTYVDFTGTPEGAMYGLARDVNAVVAGSISHKTNIPNLLLTGQSITSHGMLGVLAGSFLTCAEILTIDHLFTQLENV